MSWQPISQAPKDKTKIDVLMSSGDIIANCYYYTQGGCDFLFQPKSTLDTMVVEPTHFVLSIVDTLKLTDTI